MCKKIVELHGGTISIDTTYTEGTRFSFTLLAIRALPRCPTTVARGRCGRNPPMTPAGRPDQRPARQKRCRRRTHHAGRLARHNKIKNTPACGAGKPGGSGLPLPARRPSGDAPRTRSDPDGSESAEEGWRAVARRRMRTKPFSATVLVVILARVGGGGALAQLQTARQRLRLTEPVDLDQRKRGAPDRRILRSGGPASAAGLNCWPPTSILHLR